MSYGSPLSSGMSAGVALILGCTDATQSIFTNEDVDSLAESVVRTGFLGDVTRHDDAISMLIILGGTADDVEGSTCVVDEESP